MVQRAWLFETEAKQNIDSILLNCATVWKNPIIFWTTRTFQINASHFFFFKCLFLQTFKNF